MLLAWALVLFAAAAQPARAEAGLTYMFSKVPPAVTSALSVYAHAASDAAPEQFKDVEPWLARKTALPNVDMRGGRYWLSLRIAPQSAPGLWVIEPANSFFNNAHVTVLGSDGSRQSFQTGLTTDTEFVLHRGKSVKLAADTRYWVLVDLTTPFFSSQPRVDVWPIEQYREKVLTQTVLLLMALGAMLGLLMFNLFIGLWSRQRTATLYALQLICSVVGWSFYFNVPYDWLGVTDWRVNYAPWFFLLSITHCYFCIHFLELRRIGPSLARVGDWLALLAAALLPVCWLAPAYSHLVATFVVGSAVSFAVASAIWALSRRYRPARFFLLAYLAVLIPGLIILPPNLGIIPDFVENSDLLTLLGTALEAMLLGFAQADQLALADRSREQFRQQMQDARRLADTDALTELGNRHAFDKALEEYLTQQRLGASGALLITIIDLDGLKVINDTRGHAHGDALIRAVAAELAALQIGRCRAYRLGGDEFALLSINGDSQALATALSDCEKRLRETDFPEAGLSFGMSMASNPRSLISARELTELVALADGRMYEHKRDRRQGPRALRAEAA
ncbi:hypothetical protein IP84_10880 [beta proteobacterium AAP99]|nr:hypothetical protein IP84_10880 [beta proteobacterium AAP99]